MGHWDLGSVLATVSMMKQDCSLAMAIEGQRVRYENVRLEFSSIKKAAATQRKIKNKFINYVFEKP